MDFREGHPEFVFQPPETGQEDGACEQVVLPVRALEHDCDVVLEEETDCTHRVSGQGLDEWEGFVGVQVCEGVSSAPVEGWIALREVVCSGKDIVIS